MTSAKPFLDNIPEAPGVYMMKNGEGLVVYVGKALSLKKRVRSYFVPSCRQESRLAERHLIDLVEDVSYIATRNETEAFILENNLIKKLKPRYNIRLKDDKTYLSLRVDTSHPFPAIVPVRRPGRDHAVYFGPYSSSGALRTSLRVIRRVVPLRDCSEREFKSRQRPCLKHQIGRCPGPCVGKISKKSYSGLLKKAIGILRGDVEDLIHKLEEEMARASAAMEFEEAARARNRINALKSIARPQRVENIRFYDADFMGACIRGRLAAVAVLSFREGKLISKRPFTFDLAIDARELISQFLLRYYDGIRYIPEAAYVPIEVPEMDAVEARIKSLRGAAFRLKVPKRGDAAKLLEMARENAGFSLDTLLKERKNTEKAQMLLKVSLGLKRVPASIEGVDISTMGGAEAVGAVVRFEEGRAVRSMYRKYRIKSVEGMDDYAMIREVVLRRLKRGADEGGLPDLILVDGGIGQLNCALEAAHELDVTGVDFLGIQKGETRARAVCVKEGSDDMIVAPSVGATDKVPAGSLSMHLLQRVRDEAHRFAISYHRKRMQKAGISSPLDSVNGLGRQKKQRVLSRFGGLRELMGASREEISMVPGVGAVLADRIYRSLHR